MDVQLVPFQPLGPTVGWQTSTDSIAYLLPLLQSCAPQMRIFNATAGAALYAYVAFGDENVVATPWSKTPPSTCDFIIGPDAAEIITLSPDQIALAKAGKLWAAACLYAGNGGIYFTPGVGQR